VEIFDGNKTVNRLNYHAYNQEQQDARMEKPWPVIIIPSGCPVRIPENHSLSHGAVIAGSHFFTLISVRSG
jgi:hypothetical protein